MINLHASGEGLQFIKFNLQTHLLTTPILILETTALLVLALSRAITDAR